MSKDLLINFDNVSYDSQTGYSLINGWAMDQTTKSPLKISSSIPAMINSVYRNDINEIFGINRDKRYGFLIQFPGDVEVIEPEFVFSSGSDKETATVGKMKKEARKVLLYKIYENLKEQGLLPFLNYKKASGEEQALPQAQPDDDFLEWMKVDEPGLWREAQDLKPEAGKKISVIVFAKNEEKDLKKTLESIEKQTIEPCEILIAKTEDYSNSLEEEEKQVFQAKTYSEAANIAAAAAQGEYLLFIDNGDELSPHALSEICFALDESPQADFLYADSDMLDDFGERYRVHFKPDYDPVLLRSNNYILHPVIVKRDLFENAGGFRPEYEGLQNYDLILRLTEKAELIKHIPRILYHWKGKLGKISAFNEQMAEYQMGRDILKERFCSLSDSLTFDLSDVDYVYELVNKAGDEQKISLITGVPEGYDIEEARKTVEELAGTVDYPEFEIITVNLGEFQDERIKSIKDLKSKTKEEIYNRAAKESKGDYLCFVEPGFHAIETSWLDEMLSYAMLDEVGIVGPFFFNDFYQIEQAGIEIDNKKRRHTGKGVHSSTMGHDLRFRLPREVFAVSSACLLIRRGLFEELEGFNTSLNSAESDLDLAIRARRAGKQSVIHNNVPAMLKDRMDYDGWDVSSLYAIYPEEELENIFINENLRSGASAHKYLKED